MIADVAVIGAGAAGLSAALVLGRARRRTIVLDGGPPRNTPAPGAHGFLTRDGTPPLELQRIGVSQLRPYGTVEVRTGRAIDARRGGKSFSIELEDGSTLAARRILLATGVADELPPVPGLAELWGRGVLHCPFCHGWEVRDQPLALYGRGVAAVEFARLLLGWSRDIVLCSDGPVALAAEQASQLQRWGVAIRQEKVAAIAGAAGRMRISFENGSSIERTALFIQPPRKPGSDLPARLGCALDEVGCVVVDEEGQTSVPGIYAAGDGAGATQQLVVAAAAGATAAMSIQKELITHDFD
jgi:thioredoxin reductase